MKMITIWFELSGMKEVNKELNHSRNSGLKSVENF